MTVVEGFSFGASLASICLAFLSVGLAVHFYIQAKDAEKSVATSLAKIETQTKALQKLTERQIDRLTEAVIDQPRQFEGSADLIAVMASLPQTIANHLHQPSPSGSDQEAQLDELINCYIAIYYYCAITNFWAQMFMPNLEDIDESEPLHNLSRQFVDSSAADFSKLAVILGKADQERVANTELSHLVSETQEVWRYHVRTVGGVYEERAKQDD